MTAPRSAPEILADRLRIVLALTEANAAHRLAQSRAGGAEFEVMTLEERAALGDAPAPDLGAELDLARSRENAARDDLSASAERLAALDDQLDALDRELAATRS